MRLLIITTMGVYPWGGSEELWYQTALAALEAGHTIGVVAFKWPQRAPQLQALVDRGVWLFERRRGQTGRLTNLLNRISDPFRGAQAFNPDLVYINQGGTYDLTCASESISLCQLIDRIGVPYCLVCQSINNLDIPSTDARAILRKRFAAARWVGFVAVAMIQTAERQLASRLSNAKVVRNPVNLSDLSPLPWPGGKTARFAFVGRLEPRKGLDLLLEALSADKWRHRDWSLDVYGDGPFRSYYEELILHFKLSDRAALKGHEPDVRQIWIDHHLLMLPSHFEGTALVIVEALLLGRPVLATDVGGSGEWVINEKTGFLAAAPTVQSIAEALERAWDARDRWEEFGMAARTLATSQFDPHAGQTILRLLTDTPVTNQQASS